MDFTVARSSLRAGWYRMSDAALTEALDAILATCGGVEGWFDRNPDLFVHPRDTCDESTLGVHQSWWTNLAEFRTFRFHDRTLYLFEYQVLALVKENAD